MRAFDNEAKYYDAFHSKKDYLAEAAVIRQLHPKAKTVFEIGSGTGLMTAALEKFGFEVEGLEPSSTMSSIAIKNNRASKGVFWDTIENFFLVPKVKYDLVIALYDSLNYISFDNMPDVLKKLKKFGKKSIIQLWPDAPVYPFTFKKADGCSRIRIGFKFMKKAYLWYFYWGKGFVVAFHKLYLHKI